MKLIDQPGNLNVLQAGFNFYLYFLPHDILLEEDLVAFSSKNQLRGRNFHGQKVSRFLRSLAFFAKVSANA